MRMQRNETQLRDLRHSIEQVVERRWRGIETLASSSMIKSALSGKGGAEVERLFDTVQKVEDVGLIVLLDRDGESVLSSSYDGIRRVSGIEYSRKPYFNGAITGRKVVYLSEDPFLKRRGIFMAVPVWLEGLNPDGVLVFKLNISAVDELIRKRSFPAMMFTEKGVVFATNRSHWLYHYLPGLGRWKSEGERVALGGGTFKPLDWTSMEDEVSLSNTRYEVLRESFSAHGWTMMGLFPKGNGPSLPLVQLRITQAGYIAGMILITTVLGLSASISKRLQAERVLNKHRETLEEMVNRRTRQLEKVNDTLVRELEEKRFAEKRLKENENSFKRANRIAGLGSWEWNLEEDQMIPSEVLMDLYDIDNDAMGGRFEEIISRVVHPDDRQKVSAMGRQMVETGKGQPIEYRIVRSDGEVRWVRAEASEVKEFRKTGEVVSLIGTVQDITERKINENFLLRLKAAMEQSVDGIAIADLDGVVEFVNPSWAEMHGFRFDELSGVNLDFFHTREQVDATLRVFLKKVMEYGSCEGEIAHVTRHGLEFSTWMSSALMEDYDGNPIGVVCLCRDITNQKQTEMVLKRAKDEAEAATRAKSAFLANMSHEIRTPMNGVIGMIDILLDTGLTDEQRDYAESVKSSADALLILINDILDFSKIEAGKLDIEVIDFNLRTVLEELSDVMAIKAKEKGLDFASLIYENVPVYLKGDPVRLRQILTNLAGNAVKFVERGSIMIRVSLKETFESKSRLFFEVVDTGIGIHRETLPKLFTSFSQGDASTTRKYGGTGLGLVISQQLTKLMSGNIGVESRIGQGSTFWFTAEFERQPDAPNEWFYSPDVLEGMHILVVDDNAVNRQVFREYARSWKCTVTEVKEALDAVSVAEELKASGQKIDAAIIDMQMPGMNGEELGKRFRSCENLKDIPLIMATSMGQRGDALQVKEAGFSAYLTKPVRKKDLCHRLIQMLTPSGEKSNGVLSMNDVMEEVRGEVRVAEPLVTSAHVLLAEDNRMNQRVAVNMLKKMGHRVTVVNNGIEAVSAFMNEPFDIILMDGQMPEMDGLEASEEIRRIEREGSNRASMKHGHIPIVAVTANAMKGDRERFLAAGMDEYISKPIKKRDLEEVITRVLKSGEEPRSGNTQSDNNSPQSVEERHI
ncbi:MAG: response regulator [Desulfobacterales bacterium]|nr:response regulator [Desulfobacterales bacterium]